MAWWLNRALELEAENREAEIQKRIDILMQERQTRTSAVLQEEKTINNKSNSKNTPAKTDPQKETAAIPKQVTTQVTKGFLTIRLEPVMRNTMVTIDNIPATDKSRGPSVQDLAKYLITNLEMTNNAGIENTDIEEWLETNEKATRTPIRIKIRIQPNDTQERALEYNIPSDPAQMKPLVDLFAAAATQSISIHTRAFKPSEQPNGQHPDWMYATPQQEATKWSPSPKKLRNEEGRTQQTPAHIKTRLDMNTGKKKVRSEQENRADHGGRQTNQEIKRKSGRREQQTYTEHWGLTLRRGTRERTEKKCDSTWSSQGDSLKSFGAQRQESKNTPRPWKSWKLWKRTTTKDSESTRRCGVTGAGRKTKKYQRKWICKRESIRGQHTANPSKGSSVAQRLVRVNRNVIKRVTPRLSHQNMTTAGEGKSASGKERKGNQSNTTEPARNAPREMTRGTNAQNRQTDETQMGRTQSKGRHETKPHGTNKAKITRQNTNQADGRETRRSWRARDNHRKRTSHKRRA